MNVTDKRLNMGEDTCQFTLKFTYQGQQCRNVIYYVRQTLVSHLPEGGATWTDGKAIDQADAIMSTYKTQFQHLTSNKCTMDGVDWVYSVVPSVGPLHEGSDSGATTPFAGLLTGDPFPTNVTIACKLGTGLGGRANHGRLYYVGLTNDQVDSPNFSNLKPGSVTDLNAALGAFRADANVEDVDDAGNGEGSTLAVISFIEPGSSSGGSAGILRNPATASFVVSFALHDSILDSQRRRLPGRGT
jgi:hypothetical protein